MTPAAQRTSWPPVLVLVLAAITAAFHIGKVAPALPVLDHALGLHGLAAAWMISLIAGMSAASGIAFGQFADRVGHRTLVVGGLACLGAASAAGALCTSAAPLLAARAVEGVGFLGTVVAMPPLLARAVQPNDRRLAIGIWSTYMPLGIALGPALAPALLALGGWPALWWTGSAASTLAAVTVALVVKPGAQQRTHGSLAANIRAVVGTRAPLAAAFAFCAYSATYISMVGFLPTIIVANGAPFSLVATAGACIALCNGGGTILGGVLAGRASRTAIMFAGFGIGSLASAAFYWPALPLSARLVCAGLGVLAAGVVPSTITGSVAVLAPRADLIGTTQGLAQQFSSAGQFIGPPLIALAGAERGGTSGSLVILALALVGATATWTLGRAGIPSETR